MDIVEVHVVSVVASPNSGRAYTLLFEEESPENNIPQKFLIIIGAIEAQAIMMAIKKIEPVRPLTHDVFMTYVLKSGAALKKVIIYKEERGVFYSMIHFIQKDGAELLLDVRTSDAVALAMRVEPFAPIFVSKNILQEQNKLVNESTEAKKLFKLVESEGDIDDEDDEDDEDLLIDLEEQLKDAVKNEKYEQASILRDKIKLIKKK